MKRICLLAGLVWRCALAQPLTTNLSHDIRHAVYAVSDIMIHDVVNPPAASRYYAYILLGAYEIVSQHNKDVPGLASMLKDYTRTAIAMDPKNYDYRVASLYCIIETGKRMLPSGYLLEKQEDSLVWICKKAKIPVAVIDSSISVAKQMALAAIAYSKKDNYNKLSAKLGYTPKKGEAYWDATPPVYMEAVEPNWKIIRPMIIDSAGEFKPMPLVPFSKDSTSPCYKLAMEVYTVSKHASQEYMDIANFWDCNPFNVSTEGHMMLGFKKISPGGHWMNIAGIAAREAGLSFDQSVVMHTLLAVGLMDAFISCWEEKFRSNRIRPVTYINRYIDVRWEPQLQTPPFPEYTSGHSIVSSTAAEILSYFLGNHFSFTDNTEIPFGIVPRKFGSFRQAAEEAAISRLYGGIHFRDAIENGLASGRQIGGAVIKKMNNAGMKPFPIASAK
jgi:hypothetical protein